MLAAATQAWDLAFFAHPRSVGETWWQHAKAALHISFQAACASGEALVHALVPCLCTRSASARVAALARLCEGRLPKAAGEE